MAKFKVRFFGIMCHYDPVRDNNNHKPYRKRTIVINGAGFMHPHEAFLAVSEDAVKEDNWGGAKYYTRQDDQSKLQRYTLEGVRIEIPSNDVELMIDPTFENFVPPLGQVIQDFPPIRPEFINFDSQQPDLVAAHFDMKGGTLRTVRFDQEPSRFEPPYLWPPPDGTSSLPLALITELELDVDNSNGIAVVGEFYKTGQTRTLLLDPETTSLTIGNLIPEEIEGKPAPPGSGTRAHHFQMYADLSQNRVRSIPKMTMGPTITRGASGGCPGTQYPP